MVKIKWGIFPAAAAFLLSFLISLVFGQVFVYVALLRAVIFAAVFFGIGCGAWVLISNFVPELLLKDTQKAHDDGIFPIGFGVPDSHEKELDDTDEVMPQTGSRVSITLDDDDTQPAALPEGSDGMNDIGNISDLISEAKNEEAAESIKATEKQAADIDQNGKSEYNIEAKGFDTASDDSEGEGFSAMDTAGLGDFSSFLDGFSSKKGTVDADDSISDLFQAFPDSSQSIIAEEAPQPRSTKSTNKPTAELDGSFNPQEIAAGIQTMLAKEGRG